MPNGSAYASVVEGPFAFLGALRDDEGLLDGLMQFRLIVFDEDQIVTRLLRDGFAHILLAIGRMAEDDGPVEEHGQRDLVVDPT